MAFEPKRIEITDDMRVKPSKDVSGLLITGNVTRPPIPGVENPWIPDMLKGKTDFNVAQSPHNTDWETPEHEKHMEAENKKREDWVHETDGGKKVKKSRDLNAKPVNSYSEMMGRIRGASAKAGDLPKSENADTPYADEIALAKRKKIKKSVDALIEMIEKQVPRQSQFSFGAGNREATDLKNRNFKNKKGSPNFHAAAERGGNPPKVEKSAGGENMKKSDTTGAGVARMSVGDDAGNRVKIGNHSKYFRTPTNLNDSTWKKHLGRIHGWAASHGATHVYDEEEQRAHKISAKHFKTPAAPKLPPEMRKALGSIIGVIAKEIQEEIQKATWKREKYPNGGMYSLEGAHWDEKNNKLIYDKQKVNPSKDKKSEEEIQKSDFDNEDYELNLTYPNQHNKIHQELTSKLGRPPTSQERKNAFKIKHPNLKSEEEIQKGWPSSAMSQEQWRKHPDNPDNKYKAELKRERLVNGPVNPAKEKAALRVRKAIILTDSQLGKAYEPIDDLTLVKAFGTIEAIPDLFKSERMPQEFFERAFERVSMFDEKPVEYIGKLWYGETTFEKGILGAGIGALAGHALGGPIGAAAGGMGGTAIEDKVGKSKKSEKSMDEALVPWTKSQYEDFMKGVLGAGIGGLAGGALAGPVGAAAGGMAGTAIEDKLQKPKKPVAPEPVQAMKKAEGIEPHKDPEFTQWVHQKRKQDPEFRSWFDSGAVTQRFKETQDSYTKKADPKMIKEKALKLCKMIAKSENGTEDLSTITSDQFNRALFQASYDIIGIDKAVAEPIDSKYNPKERKPTFDNGGESEISHSPTTANVSELAAKSEKVNWPEFKHGTLADK